jgi:hypothetical protein
VSKTAGERARKAAEGLGEVALGLLMSAVAVGAVLTGGHEHAREGFQGAGALVKQGVDDVSDAVS